MSTNYYWSDAPESTTWTNPIGDVVTVRVERDDPSIHICQYAHCRMPGDDRIGRYSWAQEPERVIAYCKANPNKEVIVSEYGTPFTGAEFVAMVNSGPWDRSMIGKVFF
jgi:hypothetical protein